MSTPKLTPAQVALLRAVAEGKVDRLDSYAYYADFGGRIRRQVTDRARKLDAAGLINPLGVAMKHGRPKKPEEQFPDYHVVTLTPAGEQALQTGVVPVAEGSAGGER